MTKVAGIDLGGTKIQGVVLDGDGVVADAKVPSPQTGGADIAAAIGEMVRTMAPDGVERIGIGAPGVIDAARGAVLAAPNLAIDATVPLTDLVADAAGIDRGSVRLDNDVNVARSPSTGWVQPGARVTRCACSSAPGSAAASSSTARSGGDRAA